MAKGGGGIGTQFSHASTLIRRRRNNISEIKLENGGENLWQGEY